MVLAAVGQICSNSSMSHNLAQCQTLIVKAVEAGAKALFLPEAADYIAPSTAESVSLAQPITTSPFVQGLRESAAKHKLAINVGIHEPTNPPSKRIRNSLIWISSAGKVLEETRYHKLHLFDIDLSNQDPPGPVLKESNSTEPGNEILPAYEVAELSDSKHQTVVGSQICFDVRFVEPLLRLRRQGANVVVYPSAFTVPTGKAHWEALLRARAIESQCWIVGSAQCGRHNAKRVSYGESIVVDPQGRVAGRLSKVDDADQEKIEGREPELLVVDIDHSITESARKGIPVAELRRWDVYPKI